MEGRVSKKWWLKGGGGVLPWQTVPRGGNEGVVIALHSFNLSARNFPKIVKVCHFSYDAR